MNKEEFKMLESIKLSDDELLVITGGINENEQTYNCDLGRGLGCGRGCGGCTPASNPSGPSSPSAPSAPSTSSASSVLV